MRQLSRQQQQQQQQPVRFRPWLWLAPPAPEAAAATAQSSLHSFIHSVKSLHRIVSCCCGRLLSANWLRPRLLLDLLLRPTDVREKEKLRELQSVVSAFPTCKDEREREPSLLFPCLTVGKAAPTLLCSVVVEEYNRRSRVPCLPCVCLSCQVGLSVQFSSVQFSVFSLQLSVARAVAGQVFCCSVLFFAAAEKHTAVVYIFVALTCSVSFHSVGLCFSVLF